MRTLLILLITFLMAASCTKEADIKLPEQEEKLVVTCFISPDDTLITAVVRTSTPRYNASGNSDHDVITNASVQIRSNGTSVTIPFVDSLYSYVIKSSDFPVVPGGSYTLDVRTPDGKFSSAQTTVPADTLPIRYLDIAMKFSPDSTSLDVSLSAEVADIPQQTNYVALFQRTTMYTPYDSIYSMHDYYDPGFGTFFDDEKQSRQAYSLFSQAYSQRNSEKVRYTLFVAELSALNCSKDFYLYNRSAQQAAWTGNNPFGDPVLVYTNMSNGFGCFGAYRITKRIQYR